MADYPKTIVAVDHVEPVARRIRAQFAGATVLDTAAVEQESDEIANSVLAAYRAEPVIAEHQTGGGRREAADLVQVDDLEWEDQPIAEEVDRVPTPARAGSTRAGPSGNLSLDIAAS